MSRRKLDIRRQKNRELAALDAKHRCAYCKAPLGPVVHVLTGDLRTFCSAACRDQANP